ncbi:MAG: hypothetical protein CSA15_01355 [Candidatus Delongbacteria bacterium]|nr:MAG: hypothetical protein CSA15_01355 [Candidatus Delongbacteria bacterium]
MYYIKKFLKIIPFKDKVRFLLIGLLMGLGYIITFFIPLTQKRFINVAIDKKEVFNYSFYILIFLYISSFIISLSHSTIYGFYHNTLKEKLTLFFYVKILRIKKSSIKKKGVGFYFDCLTGDLDRALYILSPSLFSFIFSTIQTLFIFIIVWRWSPYISIVFIFALLLSIATSIFSSKLEKRYWSRIRNSSTKVSSFTIDSFMNNQIINFTQTTKKFSKIFDKNYKIQTKVLNKNAIRHSASESFLSLISTFSLFMVIIFSISLVLKEEMSYGELLAIISYYQMLFHPVDNFFDLTSTYFSTNVSIKRILDIEQSSLDENKSDYLPQIVKIDNFKLENINLTYYNKELNKEKVILKDGKFNIINFQKVGIVGLSGEGKSSLLKLFEKDFSNLKEGYITGSFYNIVKKIS